MPAPALSSTTPTALPGHRPAPGLLRSKLIPPGATAAQVPRSAVCRAIVAASAVKLILVRAPAGFGKTSAMVQARQHLAASGVATAWLTLDRADNDMPRFLAGLQQAVLRLVNHPGADPVGDRPGDHSSSLAGHRTGQATGHAADTAAPESSPDPAAALGALDTLAAHDAPFALFLDDFELITETAVLGLVREIVEHLPRRGQLVLGSRSLPDLGLGRLRAAGQLLEIDTEQLRFTLAEAQQFFALRHPGAGPAGSAATDLQNHLPDLLRKTEGWIAALWLASMALDAVMARHGSVADFIHQFSGSDRAVADFLAEDVLARQTPEIRDFLLRTSLLRQLSAPLCQALCPRADARRILAQLDAANLFITPIGQSAGPAAGNASSPNPSTNPCTTLAPEREWRYHSLFADFLRAQLARERPDELARLHLAAAGWYEAEGRPVPAIDHAIEGGDGPLASGLLARHAMAFLAQGRMRLLARWFAALPSAPLRAQPMLQVVSLWASSLTRGPWEAMAQLQQSGIANSTDPAVLAHVHALQPMLLAMMDRVEDASAIGQAHLAKVPTGQPFADSVLCNAMAHVMGVLGERAQSQRLLDAARRGQPGNGFNRMYSESVEGLQDLQQGRLRQATARFRLAVGVASGVGPGVGSGPGQPPASGSAAVGGFPPSHGNAWAGVLYAGAVYEAHQLALAEHLLNIYLPLARDVGLPDHMILSHTMRSRIAFQRGDIDAALHTITELEYLGHHRQLPRVVASARLERARVLVLQGQADAAALALDRADDASVWQRVAQQHMTAHDVEDMAIGRLRWQVAFGDAPAAARQAALLAQQARKALRLRRALRLQVLQALAWLRCGEHAAAADGLAAVLQPAAAEGFVHLLLDEGPALGALLRCLRDAQSPGMGQGSDPITADHLQHLLRIVGADPDDAGQAADSSTAQQPQAGGRSSSQNSPATGPVEALTRKEIRVLQLLAEGYSNGAMAEKLFVSDSTVRTHLRNINMKLDARSRTQAVAIARRLGLMR